MKTCIAPGCDEPATLQERAELDYHRDLLCPECLRRFELDNGLDNPWIVATGIDLMYMAKAWAKEQAH